MTVPGLKILFPGSRKRNPLTDNIFPISKKPPLFGNRFICVTCFERGDSPVPQ